MTPNSQNAAIICVHFSLIYMKKYKFSDETYISPNLRNLAYRYGMTSAGDSAVWEVVMKRFMAEENAQEKKKLLHGLGQKTSDWSDLITIQGWN
jgi:hypothetical protein